ncbi:MAG TPA: aromatic amino acid ammonia-lyase, partial [Burkholderiales bacterium]|nr:aromatic amino acid ammonia-lyase [Burkholderiales bacterium]
KSVSLDKVKTGTQTQEFIRQQEKMRKMTPTVEGVTESERATLKELQEAFVLQLGKRQGQNNELLRVLRSLPYPNIREDDSIELRGDGLTLEQVGKVAQNGVKVVISPEGMARVKKGFDVVMEAARQNKEVYGLTVGVGWNKDQSVFGSDKGELILSEELLEVSREFNMNELRAHAAGLGDPMPADIVRAGMLIRLNTMLTGGAGVQPEVVRCFADFINHDIVPIVPKKGTIGQSDITLASHLGLAIAGEGDVLYKGERMSAADAMAAAKINAVRPVGKDFLSILSTNSLTAASAVLAVKDAEDLVRKQAVIFSLCLEGINGNIAPFLKVTTDARPFPCVIKGSEMIRDALEGSSLWEMSEDRPLQDPLSYRDMASRIGDCMEEIDRVKAALTIQINSSDDNPYVATRESEIELDSGGQVSHYALAHPYIGAIYPSANFDAHPFVSPIKKLLLSLNDLTEALTKNIVVFENPTLTGLPRYLKASDKDHGLGEVHKPLLTVRNDIQQVTTPVPTSGIALAGGIEDMETNSGLVVKNLHRTVKRLCELASIQLLYAAQAVDLRKDITLGTLTKQLRDAFREVVPFIDKDRAFTDDLDKGTAFAKKWSPKIATGREAPTAHKAKGVRR